MTGTEIAEYEPQTGTLALRGDQVEWSPVQQAALAHIGIENAPPPDQQVFMHVCQRTGLDPFAKQIYMIARSEGQGANKKTKWTIQTGIDGFRLIAERHTQYRGQIGPQWCGPDGVWQDVWLDPQKPPVAARVGILRGDRDEPTWGVALFREYAQYTFYDGQHRLTKMWREKGAHMVGKCAEALGVRRAFPQEIGGLVTDDEMGAVDRRGAASVAAGPARGVSAAELTGAVVEGDVEPNEPDSAPPDEPDPDPGPGPGPEEDPLDGPATAKDNRRMHALFREAGVTGRPDRLHLTGLLLGRELDTSKGLTGADAQAVIAALDDLKNASHADGLPGAVTDLINAAEQERMESELAADGGGDTAAVDVADDDPATEGDDT